MLTPHSKETLLLDFIACPCSHLSWDSLIDQVSRKRFTRLHHFNNRVYSTCILHILTVNDFYRVLLINRFKRWYVYKRFETHTHILIWISVSINLVILQIIQTLCSTKLSNFGLFQPFLLMFVHHSWKRQCWVLAVTFITCSHAFKNCLKTFSKSLLFFRGVFFVILS